MSAFTTLKETVLERPMDGGLRNLFFLLCLLAILAYGGSFAWYFLANLNFLNLLNVMPGDAFYYFQIAKNLAEGKFSTFDGGITRTNGYHPVWLLLITPFYWIFDPETALFGIKVLEIALIASAVVMIVLAARKARLHWFLLFAALPTLYERHAYELISGMEAAAALSMLGALFLALGLFAQDPERRKWPLAVVAFILPWVRLEYAAISLAATMTLCMIEWSWRLRDRSPGISPRTAIRLVPSLTAIAPLLAAVAGLLLYFMYNGLVFGSIVPVSGATKVANSQEFWSDGGGQSLAQNLREMLQLQVFDYELLVVAEICIYMLLIWWFRRPDGRDREDWLLLIFLVGMFSIAMGHLAKFAHNVLTMRSFFAQEATWSYVPAYLMMVLIVPVRCYVAAYLIRRFVAPKSPVTAGVACCIFLATAAVFLFINTNFFSPYRWIDNMVDNITKEKRISWLQSSYVGTRIMNRVLPEGSIIGSWDSDIIGYFSRFPVVNLDGLVNSSDYLNIRRDKGIVRETLIAKDRAGSFRDHAEFFEHAFGITHFSNASFSKAGFENTYIEIAPFIPPDKQRLFTLWSANPPQESWNAFEYFWERMKPHFDYGTDDVGVVVERWTAYTVAKDCERRQGAFPVFFLLHEHDRTISGILNPWRNAGEDRPSACTDATLLHEDSDHSVRVMAVFGHDDITSHVLGSNPPAIRSHYDVHLNGNQLVYMKDRCDRDDIVDKFFLHVVPVDISDLPTRHEPYGAHLVDMPDFELYGHKLGEVCVLVRNLPDYDIAMVRTGQYVPGGPRLWEGVIRLDVDAGRIADVIERTEPAIRSGFDVYHDGTRLLYTRGECDDEDAAPPFFLHVFPVNEDDLPVAHRQKGFENLGFRLDARRLSLDFYFKDLSLPSGVGCLALVDLPEYDIARIRTGQYVPGKSRLWEGELEIGRDAP